MYNQNMQNLQNKYCEQVVCITIHYVKVMAITAKLASFTEIYFLG